LKKEQREDDTLKSCFSLASHSKGGFFVKNDLLYHYDSVLGERCEQLCLPSIRRNQVLRLAHETYGAHMGARNTKSRIRYSFYWPTLARDVKDYVRSCSQCQLRRRQCCYDNTPIEAIPRDLRSFQHWQIDCAGPFFPNERVAYNYCLVCIDSNTRFPMAYPLRAINAKSIATSLLNLWSIFGIPQCVTMDNASCNTAKLTKELFSVMGCSPIFITPTNSRANGLAERCIGTLKELIHKTAIDHQKQWHRYLDMILWAIREVPQTSTGIPPWTLAFGYLPRGPCAILKDSWTEEHELPLNLGQTDVDYLLDLRDRLAAANSYAAEYMQRVQTSWVNRYNLRARPKSFEVGDQVLILSPDTTSSRLWARWQAPATVIEVKSPHSCIVDFQGVRKHVPISKLRHFETRCNVITCKADVLLDAFDANVYACTSVVDDGDTDMGYISYVDRPITSVDELPLPSTRISADKLTHLNSVQKSQLLSLLDQYPDVFSEKVGRCEAYIHEIRVTPDFHPKRLKEYRIPEKLRGDVRQQIKQLLDQGLIKISKSPMASPIICVLKGPGGRDGVRIVMDYRFLNKFTVSDALGPPDISSTIQRIGRARFISTFDGKNSYWAIPLKEEHQWLTAFICEGQTYEWTRAAFGLKNSGCAFLRMLGRVLHPVREFVESFVDDMAVYTFTDWETHLKHIEAYLQIIRKSGLTLSLKKINLAQPEVKFCGLLVGSGSRRIDPDRLASIRGLKVPRTKKEVRSALGVFSWFREFLPYYSDLARPLIELTKGSVPNKIPWNQSHMQAFDGLKNALCEAADGSLKIIDWELPFEIATDASNYAQSGILFQTGRDGSRCPISFFSRKFTEAQIKWPIIEREALAVLTALQRFKTWIFGYKIHVYCDHNPLSYLTDSASKSPRLLRWALALQSYDIEFHYSAGKSALMCVPDCLSRMGPDDGGVDGHSAHQATC
jgi:hypothetical protein